MKFGWPVGELRLKFAWIPTRVSDTEWIWLEHYTVRRNDKHEYTRKFKALEWKCYDAVGAIVAFVDNWLEVLVPVGIVLAMMGGLALLVALLPPGMPK